ncbi:hypothetical protein [Dyella sp. A6]|uniref:hypothetical protein n=1 Tax=Dyella aluminiiresistens TaxID=3069105 RepID=UPI002E799E60|nr:hypothetical protein [Dyella sp. A6]
MSPALPHPWRHLIRRSLRLRADYARAVDAVSEPGLRTVLTENADLLDELIAEWRTHRRAQPESPSGWRQGFQRRVDTWHWRAPPRTDAQWIRLLAREEEALLRSFEAALAQAPEDAVPLLDRQWPRLDAIHRDMSLLARAAGA